ncbi:MAG: tungstate transport system ATP-binding protein [Chloroflexota bacterium]|nr:tungstate transport system ATP-binding protein [Chloroflexota bacterium]
MIELANVIKTYEERIILDVPALCFEHGKRYALIGMNGSGKTTLLRLLAGTLKADKGEISGVAHADMGYMPQASYAFSFTVRKNVEIALQKSDQPRQAALDALDSVGMLALAEACGDKLSGGETQRMAFARMIGRPRGLLLLDEPTSAMDIRGTDQIEALLLDYAAKNDCTVIFSTHSPAQALRLAQEVVYLDQGKVVEQGCVEQVINQPHMEATRLFLQHWRL